MATVPGDPSTPQQTVAPAPAAPVAQSAAGATPDAFGSAAQSAAMTEAPLKNLSDQMALAAQRVQNQNDGLARVRGVSDFNTGLNAELNNQLSTGDLADPQSATNFQNFSDQLYQKTLDNYKGSAAGKAALAQALEPIKTTALDTFSAHAFVAKKAVFTDSIAQNLNSSAATLTKSPGSLDSTTEAFASNVKALVNAGNISPTDGQNYIRSGTSQLTKTAVQSFIDNGDFTDARPILDKAAADGNLSPEDARTMNTRLIAAQATQNKLDNAGNLEVQKFTQIMGRAPTLEERARMAPGGTGPMTPAQTIAAYEATTGHPMTSTQVDKAYGVSDASSPYGDKDLGVLVDLQPKIVAGTATPQEKLSFEAAANNYTQPKFDEQTGQSTPGKTLPPSIQDSINTAGIKLSTVQAPIGPNPQVQAQLAADPNVSMDLFGKATQSVGVGPSIARTAAGLPILGNLAPSPVAVKTQQDAVLLENGLVNTLSDNPRLRGANSAKAKADLAAQLNIAATMGQPTTEWQNKAVATDQFLAKQLREATAAMDPSNSREMQLWGQRASAAIADFRFHLNAPQVVKPEQFADFNNSHPKGTPFVKLDGTIAQTPGPTGAK